MSREDVFQMQEPRRTVPKRSSQEARPPRDELGACNDNQRQAPAGFWIAVLAVLCFVWGLIFLLVWSI